MTDTYDERAAVYRTQAMMLQEQAKQEPIKAPRLLHIAQVLLDEAYMLEQNAKVALQK